MKKIFRGFLPVSYHLLGSTLSALNALWSQRVLYTIWRHLQEGSCGKLNFNVDLAGLHGLAILQDTVSMT
jgi:hypothetical protein